MVATYRPCNEPLVIHTPVLPGLFNDRFVILSFPIHEM